MESSQDKTLPASERKIQKTRKDGQTSRSRDLSHLAVLGVGALATVVGGPTFFHLLREHMQRQFSFDFQIVQVPEIMAERLVDMFIPALIGAVILALIVNIASVVFGLLSGGWIFSLKPIMPQFSKINPLSGIKNLFSKQQLITAFKNIILTIILGTVCWFYLQSGISHVARLPSVGGPEALSMAADWFVGGILLMLIVVFIVAVIDVPLQKILFLQKLKMTHQEAKQEHKESEGSPEVKGKIRQKQREAAHRASITRVPAADFVVANPTHYSVALRYDEKTMHAPQVVAKGADLIALKIREVARENKVPVLESPILARALYAHAELNESIPSTLYTAVAQVLAYVYRLKASLKGEAPPPPDFVPPHVPEELDPHYKKPAPKSAQNPPSPPNATSA